MKKEGSLLLFEKCVFCGVARLMWAACTLFVLSSASAQDSQLPTVDTIRDALDKARFEEAGDLAQTLLDRSTTGARDRNDVLELLAIVQIAQRNGDLASQTLKLLFDRDPEHPQRVHDPGPAVDAAIARARRAVRSPATVSMQARSTRDAYGREQLDISLGEGANVVNTIHVFVRAERDARYTELVHRPSVDEQATVLLPAAPLGAQKYKWYVEARAPSGLLLARVADDSAPLESALEVLASAPEVSSPCVREPVSEPLRKRWWVWTSVSIVAAGVIVGSTIAAQ